MNVRGFAAVMLAGVLTGSELTSRMIVHPTLWKLDHQAQVRAEKLMYRRFGSIDPFLMTATVTACFVAAGGFSGRRATLARAGGSCFAGMLAVTLAGNVPINLRVLRWDDEAGDPVEWATSGAAGTASTAPGFSSTSPGSCSWRPRPPHPEEMHSSGSPSPREVP